MRLPPRRSCSPSLPKATVTATPSSSEWPSCQAVTCSGPTACSIPCCTGLSVKVMSRRSGPPPKTAAGVSTIGSLEKAGRNSQRSGSSGGPWTVPAGYLDAGVHRMTTFADQPLEEQIAQWRAFLRRRQALHGPDVEELEGHLRDQLVALTDAGLAGDEAFLVAVKRMGSLDALSREFARAHSERLWKQMVIAGDAEKPANTGRAEILVVLSLTVAAALAVKVPAQFGLPLSPNEEVPPFYFRNASLFVFPLLAVYFTWKRGWNAMSGLWLALPFAAGAVFANVYPWETGVVDNAPKGSDTEVLTILHLPIALWLAVGFAYVRGRWFDDGGRMNFVRFSGELAIYYVLIALGGGVVTGFTFMMFSAIDMNPEWFVGSVADPVRGGGGRHYRIVVGGGETKCHREHGTGADQAVHTAVHDSTARVFGNDGVDRQSHQREAGSTHRFRSAARSRRWAGALRGLRARPAGTARLLRRPATAARGQRTRGRWGGARGDRSPHLRVWLHSQQSGGAWRESHFARQPGVDRVALCELPASPGLVRRPGAMADRLSARVRRMGGTGGCRVPARVRLPLMHPNRHCIGG